jgi:hypothetical protein
LGYFALTYINLPPDNRKAPGEEISDEELEAAGQTAEDIQALVDAGAIGGEDDPIHEDHATVPAEVNPDADVNISADEAGGE